LQIIALGGGGFSTGSEPGLDVYLLEQSRATRPRIGFIATASGDAESYLLKFYARFSRLECDPTHLPFFRRTPDLEAWVSAQDVIFVGGGNTRSMLAIWQAWGLPPMLRRAASTGTLLSGASAGAICWFECGVTESEARALAPIEGLGFLAGSACPHYSEEPERRPAYERMVETGRIAPGFAIDDGAALHFVDGRATRLVVGRRGASAYRVEAGGDRTRSRPLVTVDEATVTAVNDGDELDRVEIRALGDGDQGTA